MYLYIYDTVEDFGPGKKSLTSRCLNEQGEKVIIKHKDIRRTLWVVPTEIGDAKWMGNLKEFLASRLRVATSMIISLGFRKHKKKCFIDPATDFLAPKQKVVEIEIDGNISPQIVQELPNECSFYTKIFGRTDTLVEQTVNMYKLSGWLQMPIHFSESKGLHLSSDFYDYDRFDDQAPRPPFNTAVVYNRSILNVKTGKLQEGLNTDEELVQALYLIDPAVILIYGRNVPFLYNQLGRNAIVDVHEAATDAKLVFGSYYEEVEGGIYGVLELARKTKAVEIMAEISTLTWQPWSQTARMTRRMNRVEWLLYKEFFSQSILSPDRSKQARMREKYVGGHVLRAHTGIYDNDHVHLLDYASLYPSVAIEHNICWTPDGSVLPKLWRHLIEERQRVSDFGVVMAILILVLKLLANSIYGAMASPYFRYYSPRIAKTITEKGREALAVAIQAVGEPYLVIYGDTDSIFILATSSSTLEDGCYFARAISTHFTFLKMKHESIYKFLLLIGKKCYVAIDVDDNVVIKGMMCVKKQYCNLGKKLVLAAIERLKTIRDYSLFINLTLEDARNTVNRLVNNQIEDISDLMVIQQLSRKPEEYDHPQGKYLVEAALACKNRQYERNDYVRYYMFDGRTPIAHEDLKDHDISSIDVQWYCSQLQSMLAQLLSTFKEYRQEDLYDVFFQDGLSKLKRQKVLTSSSSSSSSLIPFSSLTLQPTPKPSRQAVEIFCHECDDLIYDSGLIAIEEELKGRLACAPEHHTLLQDIIMPSTDCYNCGTPLNLESRALTLVKEGNKMKRTHALVNYDCNRLLSQLPCLECRDHLHRIWKMSGLYDQYEKILRILEN